MRRTRLASNRKALGLGLGFGVWGLGFKVEGQGPRNPKSVSEVGVEVPKPGPNKGGDHRRQAQRTDFRSRHADVRPEDINESPKAWVAPGTLLYKDTSCDKITA